MKKYTIRIMQLFGKTIEYETNNHENPDPKKYTSQLSIGYYDRLVFDNETGEEIEDGFETCMN